MYRKISIFLSIMIILVSLSACTNKTENIETVQDLNSAETNNSIEEQKEKSISEERMGYFLWMLQNGRSRK